MSAHAKVDKEKGELHNLTYKAGSNTIKYYRFDNERILMNKVEAETVNSRMIHDMQITDDYIIIPDLPIEFDPKKAIKENTGVYSMNMKGLTRYGFLRKDAKNADNIIWIETKEVHTCFHFVNSYQEGPNKVIVHGCIWDEMDFNLKSEHPDEIYGEGPWLKKLEFDLTTKEVKITKLMDHLVEFPLVNPNLQGKKHRYCYMTTVPVKGEKQKDELKDL